MVLEQGKRTFYSILEIKPTMESSVPFIPLSHYKASVDPYSMGGGTPIFDNMIGSSSRILPIQCV